MTKQFISTTHAPLRIDTNNTDSTPLLENNPFRQPRAKARGRAAARARRKRHKPYNSNPNLAPPLQRRTRVLPRSLIGSIYYHAKSYTAHRQKRRRYTINTMVSYTALSLSTEHIDVLHLLSLLLGSDDSSGVKTTIIVSVHLIQKNINKNTGAQPRNCAVPPLPESLHKRQQRSCLLNHMSASAHDAKASLKLKLKHALLCVAHRLNIHADKLHTESLRGRVFRDTARSERRSLVRLRVLRTDALLVRVPRRHHLWWHRSVCQQQPTTAKKDAHAFNAHMNVEKKSNSRRERYARASGGEARRGEGGIHVIAPDHRPLTAHPNNARTVSQVRFSAGQAAFHKD